MTGGTFEALGDPMRRAILDRLARGELSVGAIIAALRPPITISQPAISQHLKVLRDAGLVSVRIDGPRRLYVIDETGVGAARAWLGRLSDPLAVLAQPLDALDTELARGRRHRTGSRTTHAPEGELA